MFCVCKLSLNGRLLVLPYDRIIDKDIVDSPSTEGKLARKGSKIYYGKVIRIFLNGNRAQEYVEKINSEVEEDLSFLTNMDNNYTYSSSQVSDNQMKELFHDIKAIKNSLEIIEGDQVEIKKSIGELKTAVYEDGFEFRRNSQQESYLPHEIVEPALMQESEIQEAFDIDANNPNSQSLMMKEINKLMGKHMEATTDSKATTNGYNYVEGLNGEIYNNFPHHKHIEHISPLQEQEHVTLELPPASFRAHISDDELIEAIQSAAAAPTYSKAIRRLMDSIVPVKVEPGPQRNELVAYLSRFVKNHFNSDLGETPIRCIVREKFKDRVKSLKLYNKGKRVEAATDALLLHKDKKIKLEQDLVEPQEI